MIKFAVQSQSQTNKKYQVFLTEKGWRCNCPDFIFREKEKIACKHIHAISARLENFLILTKITEHAEVEIYQV